MAGLGRPSEVATRQSERRDVNEATRDASTNAGGAVTISCECGRGDCQTSLSLSRVLYDAIRQHRRQSIVLTGHEVSDFDRVVQYRGTIAILESTYIGNDPEPSFAREPAPLPAT